MRTAVFLVLLATWSCGKEEVLADAGAVEVGVPDAGFDAPSADMALPSPPRVVAPCEATSCRRSHLGGPPCMSYSATGDFSDTEFGIHAHASMVWDGAATRIAVTPVAGEWEPVLVLARVNGEVLFDGDVGAVRPPFHVVAESPGALTVTTVQATGIVVYVTSREALDSGFARRLPADASYTLTIDSDCGVRLRCPVNGREPDVDACGWLHYVGRRVTPRLVGGRSERLTTAALGTWWALKEGHLSRINAIVRSQCGAQEIGALDVCPGGTWRVGLADARVDAAALPELETLATRLYDGAMPSGILRTTANEAALALGDATAIMQSEGALRASWLLRNSAVGISVQAEVVRRDCVEQTLPICTGSATTEERYFASTPDDVRRSLDDLQALFDQLAD